MEGLRDLVCFTCATAIAGDILKIRVRDVGLGDMAIVEMPERAITIPQKGRIEMKRISILLVGILFLASCATTASTPPNLSFLGEYGKKLKPVEGESRWRWLKPGVDFAKYNKIMVDYMVFALAEDSEYKCFEGDEMKNLGDTASLAMVNAIKEKFPVVAEPGPDVIRVRTAIVNLKQSSPVVSGITTVIPVGLGISVIKKGTTGTWTGAGATQAEVMFLDSMTNEVLAAGWDEYKAGFAERFTKWGSVEEAFKYWAQRGVKALEAIKAAK